ncbi:MAG: LD-carboxypeptidase [Tepidanaerobacteraceae bacterium]|nr:LD-carboxypeptidase [Tepidanaerobacteraceae bacterium]
MNTEMIFPKTLKKGDTIGLVAPASPISRENISRCQEVVESLGYNVVIGNSADKSYLGYLSGDDDVRAGDINEMFERKEIDGIFCLKGGYGSCRVVNRLDLDLIRANPKVFVGYSDVTILHLVFNQICNMITFHGPMVSSNMISEFDDYTRESFMDTLSMRRELEFKNPKDKKIKTLTEGHSKGVLVGGNLCLLATSIGTPYELETKGKILFLEELNEVTYKVDRLLQQLKHSGKLSGVKGIILGGFEKCDPEHEGHATLVEVFNDVIKPLSIPTVYNVEVGHGFPTGSLPLGVTCELDATNGKIKFLRTSINSN